MAPERKPKILICDDDRELHISLKSYMKSRFDCASAYNQREALAILDSQSVDLILLDVMIEQPNEGLRLISQIKSKDPESTIVMLSGVSEFATIKDALARGAEDYIRKDFPPDAILHTMQLAIERRKLRDLTAKTSREIKQHHGKHVLVGESEAIQRLKKLVHKVRDSDSNVVITGETGTGKEIVARLLRGNLPDGTPAPFVAVDASTIQSTMAESILFGHEKGAFTGAERAQIGVFEEANGGSVFFDEISNMPLTIQAKLLRVLQEREISRLGSAKTIPLEFRVICATNRSLEEMIKAGEFKHDLFERLNVIPIQVQPLRERKEDIPFLIEHFINLHTRNKNKFLFTPEALKLLRQYDWPGNIRELSNVIAFLVSTSDEPQIGVDLLPAKLRANAAEQAPVDASFYDRIEHYEKRLLADEYAKSSGNISRLATLLQMDRSHLHTKLKQFGIHTNRS